MRIVILNNIKEAVDYGKNHLEKDDVILPICPIARHYALQNDWKITTLGSLWDKKDYFKALAVSERRIKTLVNELNEYSKSVAKNFPIEIGSYFHNNILIVIGSIHYNYFIIESIFKTINPSSWLLYRPQDDNLYRGFFPSSDWLIFNIILNSKFKRNSQILCSPIEIKKEHSRRTIKERIKEFIKIALPQWFVSKYLECNKLVKIGNISPFLKKKLLMLGSLYNWETILKDEHFQKKYYVKYEEGDQIQPLASVNEGLIDILNESVIYDSKLIYDLTVQARRVQGAIGCFDNQFDRVKKRLEKTAGVLASALPFPMQNYIAHIAVSMGKPVIVWEHGEHIADDDTFLYCSELQYCTHYLTYGRAFQQRLKKYIGAKYLKNVHKVGSTKTNIVKYESDIILYCTGKWAYTRVPFLKAIDLDTRLYNAQRDILSYLRRIAHDHKVVFKANNMPGFNEIPFELENVDVEYAEPFKNLVQQAKLVILDVPATTLIEALTTDVPLFVLTGRTPWDKTTIELLRKRAIVSDTTGDLIQHINNYLTSETYPCDIHNQEFLEAYGSNASVDDVKKNVFKLITKDLK